MAVASTVSSYKDRRMESPPKEIQMVIMERWLMNFYAGPTEVYLRLVIGRAPHKGETPSFPRQSILSS